MFRKLFIPRFTVTVSKNVFRPIHPYVVKIETECEKIPNPYLLGSAVGISACVGFLDDPLVGIFMASLCFSNSLWLLKSSYVLKRLDYKNYEELFIMSKQINEELNLDLGIPKNESELKEVSKFTGNWKIQNTYELSRYEETPL